MELRLLGPFELASAGRQVPLGPTKQRVLLAAVAVDVGRPVPVATLIDRLWDEATPADARAVLHTYVARVRAVLARAQAEPPVRLERRADGYQLLTEPGSVDLHRFRAAVERARTLDAADPRRAELLDGAVRLWRGEPLGGVPGSWAERVRERLRQQWLDALTDWAGARLTAGRPEAVIERLRDIVAEHPLAESLTARLLEALAAAGRQPEALDAYASARRRIAEELGTEPGPALRAVYERILRPAPPARASPRPAASVKVPAARPVGAAGFPLTDELGTTGRGPAQLPRDIAGFAGRRADLDRLDAVASRVGLEATATVICGIWGTAGVGKTTLSVHWAHRVRGRFPDGQLYVDLRGFDPAGVPTDPAEAVRGFLDALGVPAQRLPATADARAALYRSLVADRRMLILLDNARDAEQVRQLLPAAPRSLVLVTSRNRLASLVATDGAQPLPLDLLGTDDARELLTSRVGAGRVAAEPAAVDQLVERAARLPLALAIVAARALTEVARPLAALAAELRDDPAALGPLEPGDAASDLGRVFSWSYRTLSPPAARLFRLFGLHPGPRVSTPAAASLAGAPVDAVRPLLDELVGAHLVTAATPGRYGLHDLLRAYAADLAAAEEAAADRRAALRRLLDHYLGTALAATELLMPSLRQIEAPAPADGATVSAPADAPSATAWFAAERQTLTALVRLAGEAGFHEHVWKLAAGLREYLDRKGWTDEQAAVQTAGLTAARHLGDLAGQATAHRNLVRVHVGAGRGDLAHQHADEALRLYDALDEPVGQALAHLTLGMLSQHRNDLPAALRHHRRALALFNDVRHRAGRAAGLNNVAMNLVMLDEPAEALAYAQEALALVRDRGETWSEAAVRDTLAGIHLALGQAAAAVEHAGRCLELLQAVEDPFHTSLALRRLAEAHAALGDEVAAGAALREAAQVLDELAHPDAAQGMARLAAQGR